MLARVFPTLIPLETNNCHCVRFLRVRKCCTAYGSLKSSALRVTPANYSSLGIPWNHGLAASSVTSSVLVQERSFLNCSSTGHRYFSSFTPSEKFACSFTTPEKKVRNISSSAASLSSSTKNVASCSVSSFTLSVSEPSEIFLASQRGNGELTLSTIKDEFTPEELEEIFYISVVARTVSNAQVRRFLTQLSPGQHAQALAAVQGAKRAGLKLNASTLEVLVEKLIASGKMKETLALYQEMLRTRVVPTPRTYALLMDLCLEQGLPSSCEDLFSDMSRRGIRPTIENFELLLCAYAMHNPPHWEKAVALFDKISTQRHLQLSAKVYSALMRVYLNMRPFDWRVVYNCYYELRHHDPPIRLTWESYQLAREALVKGNAGWFRRISTFFDAWVTITPLFSPEFFKGMMVYVAVMFVLKSIICSIITAFIYRAIPQPTAVDGMIF